MPKLTFSLMVFAFFGAPAAGQTLLPAFDPADFPSETEITHPYFPLAPGQAKTLAARGTDEDGAYDERSELAYDGDGPVILGVATVAQRDMAYEDGRLVEETRDYYAQDAAGSVWYMGEDVTNHHYDAAGNPTTTDHGSAWRAGVNGALPGFMLPADPETTGRYFQEHAPADGAVDEAVFHELRPTIATGGQTFHDVIVIFETTALEPDARDLKFYAPGVGLIREEEGVDEDFSDPERIFDLVGTK